MNETANRPSCRLHDVVLRGCGMSPYLERRHDGCAPSPRLHFEHLYGAPAVSLTAPFCPTEVIGLKRRSSLHARERGAFPCRRSDCPSPSIIDERRRNHCEFFDDFHSAELFLQLFGNCAGLTLRLRSSEEYTSWIVPQSLRPDSSLLSAYTTINEAIVVNAQAATAKERGEDMASAQSDMSRALGSAARSEVRLGQRQLHGCPP